MIAFGVMLAAAAIASWIISAAGSARTYVRFSCILYAALAVAIGAELPQAEPVTYIVCAVAPASLLIAAAACFRGAFRTWQASAILILAAASGILSAATGYAVPALAALGLCVIAIIATALRGFPDNRAAAIRAIVSACALLAGISAFYGGGPGAWAALTAFTAAGLIGQALAIARCSDAVTDEKGGRAIRDLRPIGHLR